MMESTTGPMTMRDLTRVALAVGIALLGAVSVALAGAVSVALPVTAVGAATAEPTDTAPEVTVPDPTEVTEVTVPGSEETSPEDALVGAGEPDTDIDGTVAFVAVVGFLILLAIASWWMVRRSDPDAQPMPPRPAGGGPESDLI